MADRYWVGGSGNWNATSTTNWSDASGGSAGASAPTSADNVIFDANSNSGTGAFTVTVTGTSASPAACLSLSTGGAGGALDGAMTLTMGATAVLDCYGSMTIPASNFSFSSTAGAVINFRSTSSGNTLTSNGVTFGNTALNFNGAGGVWTLGSNYTSTSTITLTAGTFDTSVSNYSISCTNIIISGTSTRTMNLNGSTVTMSGTTTFNATTTTNLTFNAGTSTLTFSAAAPVLNGGGLTFYNVTFSSTAASTITVNGANTYNNFTVTSRASTGLMRVSFGASQTINGTFTPGAANTAVIRVMLMSSSTGTRQTLTVNGSVATLADVDFRDIGAAGSVATPWTGTRLGNCQNNNNITFAAGGNKYWYSATGAGGDWATAQWETTAGGTSPALNNFPLAQDTVIFRDTGLNAGQTLTTNSSWNIGPVDGSSRTLSMSLAVSNQFPVVYGNWIGNGNITVSGAGGLYFSAQSSIQTITSGGTIWAAGVYCDVPNNTFRLLDNFTSTNTGSNTGPGGGRFFGLIRGTLDLNGFTMTGPGLWRSDDNFTRSVAFNGGKIVLSGSGVALLYTTNPSTLSFTGTPRFEATYSGGTGTRTFFSTFVTSGWSASNTANIVVTGGTDTIDLSSGSNAGYFNTVDLSAFSGTVVNRNLQIFGDMIYGSGNTLGASSGYSTTFVATSGTQKLTSAGKTLDFPVIQNSPGATLQPQDNLTIGSTRTFTLTAGTLDLTGNSGNWTLSCGLFASSNSNTRAIGFGTGNITVTGSGTVWNTGTLTNLSYTGTPTVNVSNNSATAATVTTGTWPEATALNFNYTVGTYTLTDTNAVYKNVNFTGFAGTVGNAARTIYGNLIISAGLTLSAGANATTFAATSGTQQITTNGKTLDFPLTFDGVGGTFAFQDALTQGATRAFTLTNGTLQLKNGVTSTVGAFQTSGTAGKFLQSTSAGSQATISQASGTVGVSYLTIRDSNATGGATWNAYSNNLNVDAGNNDGWDFGISPDVAAYEYTYDLRSFTQPKRF